MIKLTKLRMIGMVYNLKGVYLGVIEKQESIATEVGSLQWNSYEGG